MGFFKHLGNSISNAFTLKWDNSFKELDNVFGGYAQGLGSDVEDIAGKVWKEFSGEAAQERLMKLQNQYNVENWKMQNEYNTPAAQMLRYAEAGLNPNLIYGQSNMAGSVGTVSHGAVKSGMDAVGTILSLVTGMQDLKNMKAQQSLTTQQAEFTAAEVDRYKHDTNWLKEHGLSSFSPQFERNAQVGLSYVNDFLNTEIGRQVVNSLKAAFHPSVPAASSLDSTQLSSRVNKYNRFYYLFDALGSLYGHASNRTKMVDNRPRGYASTWRRR